MSKSVLDLYRAPCHCNCGDERCCGIFNVIKDGEVICNECGAGIVDVIEKLTNTPNPNAVVQNIISQMLAAAPVREVPTTDAVKQIANALGLQDVGDVESVEDILGEMLRRTEVPTADATQKIIALLG